jgi:hypothetical protein
MRSKEAINHFLRIRYLVSLAIPQLIDSRPTFAYTYPQLKSENPRIEIPEQAPSGRIIRSPSSLYAEHLWTEPQPPNAQENSFLLQKLPLEIRQLIYQMVFGQNQRRWHLHWPIGSSRDPSTKYVERTGKWFHTLCVEHPTPNFWCSYCVKHARNNVWTKIFETIDISLFFTCQKMLVTCHAFTLMFQMGPVLIHNQIF